jgi:EAL domain-containing protein (putative c-di-GMP-specific phosphodiesterase class I)
VTVEGLETAAQMERMRSLTLDYAQGFYFAAPMPPDEAAKLLSSP